MGGPYKQVIQMDQKEGVLKPWRKDQPARGKAKVQSGKALLVCAYEDEERYKGTP